MTNPHPTVEQVTQSLPDYTEVQEIGRGGFKTVFRAKHRDSFEVVKLIGLPKEGLTDQEKLFRDECLGRAVRETRILGGLKKGHGLKKMTWSKSKKGQATHSNIFSRFSDQRASTLQLGKRKRVKRRI